MTALSIQCPHCDFTGRVPSEMIGRPVRCKQCKTRFTVADPSVPETATPPARQAPVATAAPTPTPAEPVATQQRKVELDIDLAGDDPGWKPGSVAPRKWPPRLAGTGKTLSHMLLFIPIAARISIILGVLVGLDWLKEWLNPFNFHNIPNPFNLAMIFMTDGIYGVLHSLWSSQLALKLLFMFWVSRQIRSWWRNRSVRAGGVYGDAAWATEPELNHAGMLGNQGVLLARVPSPRISLWTGLKRVITSPLAESDAVIRYLVTALSRGILPAFTGTHNMICIPKGKYVHLLTVAPSGAGKGVGVVITNLLNYIGSVIVVDPTGVNFKATAEHRRSKLRSNVLCLDPFGITDSPSATCNPFDLLDPFSITLVDDARAFAEALIVKSEKDHDPFWNDQATMFLQAVILLVACEAPAEERNLNTVRIILTNMGNLRAAIARMIASTDAGGMLARLGGQMAAIDEKTFSGILASVNRHLLFLDSPLVATNVASSSFDMQRIAASQTSLYLVMPPQFIRSHAGLIRLWLNCILHVVKKRGASERDEILFLLDEVAQLGQLQPLEDAVTLLRGYGLRIWFFLQSLDQLKVCFPGAHANVLLSNFGVQQFFQVNDPETAKYISTRIGKTTLTATHHQQGRSRSGGRNWSSGGNGSGNSGSNSSDSCNAGFSTSPIERDLIRPEEVMNARDSVFIFAPRINPVLGTRLTYHSDPEFEPAVSGAGLVTGGINDPGRRKVSLCSCAVALCGVLLAAYVVPSMMAASARRQQTAAARKEQLAKQAEARKVAAEERKAEMERRRLAGEEPTPTSKQRTRRPSLFATKPSRPSLPAAANGTVSRPETPPAPAPTRSFLRPRRKPDTPAEDPEARPETPPAPASKSSFLPSRGGLHPRGTPEDPYRPKTPAQSRSFLRSR